MAEIKNYTPAEYAALQEELELYKAKREENKKDISTARSFGDLSENSEYDEARDQQAKVEARIAELEYLIKNAEVVDTDTIKNVVALGTSVVLKYADGKEVTYHIVGSNEVDPLNKKISDQSPIGRAVVGSKKGSTVIIETPNGEKEAKILNFFKTK